MIQVVGVLTDPMNQATKASVRVEALDSQVTFKGAVAILPIDVDGVYDFQLVEGVHRIEVNYSDEYLVTGEVEIDGDTPTGLTLPVILRDYVRLIVPTI